MLDEFITLISNEFNNHSFIYFQRNGDAQDEKSASHQGRSRCKASAGAGAAQFLTIE